MTELARARNAEGAAQVLGQTMAFQYLVLPLDKVGTTLHVAASRREPTELHELETLTRCTVVVDELLPAATIRERLRELYREPSGTFGLGVNALREESARALVLAMVEEAIAAHSSDIHLEPTESGGRVRFRVDRTLRLWRAVDAPTFASLVSVVKLDAELRVDAKAIFQDGSFSTTTRNGRRVDVRVNVIPLGDHEKVALRLLGSFATMRAFEELGMVPGLIERYQYVLSSPSGVHIVCGPTGSGKTTTVFAVLATVDHDKNVVTIEDPVEIRLPDAHQVNVDERNGVTFATAMRAFMRQDPDVILCGEIRDDDTAQETLQAGLSGRVIYTTIHAPDAVRVIDRLIEFGVRRGTIGSALKSVLAQRIVRRLCEHCKEARELPMWLRKHYPVQCEESEATRIFARRRDGCVRCEGTGIAGQLAVFELLVMNDELEDGIVHEASRAGLYALATANRYVPMREHAAKLILAGQTSIDEVQATLSLSKIDA